jgi:hypothetical protein
MKRIGVSQPESSREEDAKRPSRRDLVARVATLAAGAAAGQAAAVTEAQAAGPTPAALPGVGLLIVLGPDASGRNRLYFIDSPTLDNFEITGAVPNPNDIAAGVAGRYSGVRAAMYGDGVNYRLATYPNPELQRGKRLRRVPDLRPSVNRRETYNASAVHPIFVAEAVSPPIEPQGRRRRPR